MTKAEPHDLPFLDLLWAAELQAEIEHHGLGMRNGANRWEMTRDLTLNLTGKQIREAVCRQLRGRVMAEAAPRYGRQHYDVTALHLRARKPP